MAGSTKVLTVRGGAYKISLDKNLVIIEGWSEIGMLGNHSTLLKEYFSIAHFRYFNNMAEEARL